ncbi:MAG: isocitrate/isopropylmalate dehydrogenase family protein [Anaerolineales bacterium]|nr:isocitrate/isopropylmalate dehydrogenase family protein [Anaerolineales bacterium]
MQASESSKKHRIAWLPGDGVGVDVLEATKIVLDKLQLEAEYVHGDIGWNFWCNEGDALPQRTIDLLKGVDAAMFGAITSKPVKEAAAELAPELQGQGMVYRSPIVRLRQLFDLYICLRPCKAYPGNPLNYRDDIDLVIFRENTEDLYSGVEFNPVPQELADALAKYSKPFSAFKDIPVDEMAISSKVVTRKGSERIIRAAFDFARKHKRRKVTVIHKANVVRASEGLFLEVAREVRKDYPEVEMDDANVDAICMWLVKNPGNYDVLVATNMFGDIVSDLSAQLVGGLGFGCSGNIGLELGVFEPSHGSAPKYAGQYKVNPIATILSAKMMLDWLGEADKAAAVERAVAAVLREGAVRTYDMGGSNSTLELGEAIAAKL